MSARVSSPALLDTTISLAKGLAMRFRVAAERLDEK